MNGAVPRHAAPEGVVHYPLWYAPAARESTRRGRAVQGKNAGETLGAPRSDPAFLFPQKAGETPALRCPVSCHARAGGDMLGASGRQTGEREAEDEALSRRDFLKAARRPRRLRRGRQELQPDSGPGRLGVAIIGCGNMGGFHLRTLLGQRESRRTSRFAQLRCVAHYGQTGSVTRREAGADPWRLRIPRCAGHEGCGLRGPSAAEPLACADDAQALEAT